VVKIDFSFDSKYGTFADALHLPDDHGLTEAEIEQMKQDRFTNWIAIIEAPAPEEPLPEDVEYRLSQLVGPAADQLLGKDQAEAQAEKNAAESEDPILQLEIQKLELKKQEMQDKNQREMAKLNADLEKAKLKAMTDEKRIKSQERIEGTRLGVDIAKTRGQQGISAEQVANQAKEAGMRLGMDMLAKQEDLRLRNKQIDQSKPPQSGGDNE